MRRTRKQVIGTQFEIWLENYFKDHNFAQVMRNVEFHKSKNLCRQADLVFSMIVNNKVEMYLVEAKYSSNGLITYKLPFGREYKEKAGSGRLTNLVDEIIERQKFIGAYRSILVTNKYFDNTLRAEAMQRNIILFDRDRLLANYKDRKNKNDSLETEIRSIKIDDYNLNKNILWI
jgi:hypothetical protein